MSVINITREGVRVSDLEGRIISEKEAAPVYDLVRKLNAERREGTKDHDTNARARKS